MPDDEIKFARAKFKVVGAQDDIEVHFNPESLQYTITNTLKNKGRGNNRKQYVSESTGKLTMDLVFDTTDKGEDVRLHTVKVAKFMEPTGDKTPPVVVFTWGLYRFKGMVENYKETIDFFSANGVPLRASVNLTLSSQDRVFEGGSREQQANTADRLNMETQAISATPRSGRGISELASQGGNPDAARAVGQDNGIDNIRFPEQDAVELSGSPSLRSPVDFSVGAGFDVGISAVVDAGAGTGVGAIMSAGVSASAGAFRGLRTHAKAKQATTTLRLDNFIDTASTANLGMEGDTGFGLDGRAGLNGSASFRADVGKSGELAAKIEFDGE
jgi:hypothetical protein